jgi:hypothetical protein
LRILQVPLTQKKSFQACQHCQLSWKQCYLIEFYKKSVQDNRKVSISSHEPISNQNPESLQFNQLYLPKETYCKFFNSPISVGIDFIRLPSIKDDLQESSNVSILSQEPRLFIFCRQSQPAIIDDSSGSTYSNQGLPSLSILSTQLESMLSDCSL